MSTSTLDFLQVLWRLNHAMETRSSRMYRELGITGQQRMVMRYISANPGISAGNLAQLLHVDRGTMSTMLGRLEERGLVVRQRQIQDARKTETRLTAEGERLLTGDIVTVESAAERLLQESDPGAIVCSKVVIDRFAQLLEDDSVTR